MNKLNVSLNALHKQNFFKQKKIHRAFDPESKLVYWHPLYSLLNGKTSLLYGNLFIVNTMNENKNTHKQVSIPIIAFITGIVLQTSSCHNDQSPVEDNIYKELAKRKRI